MAQMEKKNIFIFVNSLLVGINKNNKINLTLTRVNVRVIFNLF